MPPAETAVSVKVAEALNVLLVTVALLLKESGVEVTSFDAVPSESVRIAEVMDWLYVAVKAGVTTEAPT